MSDKPMSQEDIDALLAGLGGDTPAAPAPEAAAGSPHAAPGTPAGGGGDLMIGQGELDALMAGFSDEPQTVDAMASGGPGAPPLAAPGPVDQNELDALLDQMEADDSAASAAAAAVPPPAAPAAPSGPLGQDDIDQILANLDSGAAPAPAAVAPDAPLGQDGIDALLAGLDGGGDNRQPAAAAAPAAADSGSLGQDGIDALLAGLSGGGAAAPGKQSKPAAPAVPPGASLGQDGIDALLAGLSSTGSGSGTRPGGASKAKSSAVTLEMPVGKLGQDDIDSLLNALGAEQVSVGADKKAPAPPSGSLSRATLALSTEDLSSLVNKHTQNGPGDAGEGMIDQQDIDALVKQLGAATGSQEAPPPTMSQELAKHDAAIDQLLGEAKPGPGSNGATMDAIDMRSVLDKPPSSSALGSQGKGPSYTVNVPVLTPPELRGARWLLAAAVLLLAICAGTLVVVAGAVRTLGTELAHERLSNLEPGDDYTTDYAAAVARLASPDAEQVATGVLFLGRLKKRYPSHEAEIGLTLARHFRAHGAWREAAQQYAEVSDDPHTAGDDPRTLVEYADTLRQLDEPDSAKRQLYTLLADESHWTAETLPAAIAERNRHTLVDAHLLLGRLLNGGGAPTVAAVDEPHEAAGHDGHAAPAEHAEGHH
jgi:hypothetical protein